MAAAEYYAHLFPHALTCRLLGRAWRADGSLERRELCVETTDDVFIRWLSVRDGAQLKRLFVTKRVSKFHAGAIYDGQLATRKARPIHPLLRELVFDIDVNDYARWGIDPNDLATCDAAWPLVAFGMNLLRCLLRDVFGFKNTMLVYSGRRGAHLSVYDARACALTDEARAAVAAWFSPTQNKDKTSFRRIVESPGFASIYSEMVQPFWESMCVKPRAKGGFGLLDSVADVEAFVEAMGGSHARWLEFAGRTGHSAWSVLTKYADNSKFSESTWASVRQVVLQFVWPVLDVNVTKRRDHLNKQAFSLHAKTDRVCLPVFGEYSDFDPASCPTAALLAGGDAAAQRKFQSALDRTTQFVDALAAAGTEKWQPPRLNPAPIQSFSLLGKRTAAAAKAYDMKNDRFCIDCRRVFCAVASSCQPGLVEIYFYTEVEEAPAWVLPSGYPPPFRDSGRSQLSRFVRSVKAAVSQPSTEFVCASVYLCAILGHSCTSATSAKARLDRLKTGLRRSQSLCLVNTKWDNESIFSIMRSSVAAHLATSRVELH